MTREEAIDLVIKVFDTLEGECNIEYDWSKEHNARDMAIEALKQEPCEDEIILTKEEYGQLLSDEFDNGYTKGYREALKQEDSVLDKIRADIENMEIVYDKSPNYEDDRTDEEKAVDLFNMDKFLFLQIIDKYKAGSEV